MISLEAAPDGLLTERTPENRDRIVRTYAYLCARGAKKFLRTGIERCDLEQVASIGLLKAYERYNESLQTPFEAYAWLFIVGELMHYVRDYERVVRPPRKLRSLEKRYQAAVERLTLEFSRVPNDREVAQMMELDLQTVRDLRECRVRATAESFDVLTDAHVGAENVDLERLLDRMLIDEALSKLSHTERRIVVAVYAGGMSQVEVALHLGYSQRHISRLHRSALEKMLPNWVQ